MCRLCSPQLFCCACDDGIKIWKHAPTRATTPAFATIAATGDMDMGRHTVCVSATDDFLAYSKSVGNDLSTPMPMYNFPGLKDGDIWCLCAQRWAQAYNAGKAPKLYLQSTHEKTLDDIPLDILKVFAIDAEEASAVADKLNLQRSRLNDLLSKDAGEDRESFQ